MPDKYWFGVTITFLCPECKQSSTEKMALSATINDPDTIKQAINRQTLSCQRCEKPLRQGEAVYVDVQPSNLETLSGWVKFQLPDK